MTRPKGIVPAPLRLRLKAKRCGCVCHTPNDWGDPSYPPAEGTPTHHGAACCSRYVGTVNEGWSGWAW